MIQIKVDLGNLPDNLTRLAKGRALVDGLAAAALHVKGKIAVYPAQKRLTRKAVYGKTFVSAAQRRYVMAALKRGDWPYQRGVSDGSETLGRRWTTAARNGGLVQVVGNNASYADRVQGDNQSLYHKAVGWKRVDEIGRKLAPDVRRIVSDHVRRAV